ncbi:TPM domain-containing protein, partial [Actinotalea ferrariae]|uniref:TPM domain-containing protein n=1 Tax=Actinotalea ferrariae TaxID=1386098 RepID=UPI001C8BE1C0
MLRPRRSFATPRAHALAARGVAAFALTGTLVTGVLAAGPAAATPPIDLADELTDAAGVLGVAEERAVEDALDRLADETPYQLFVVFVDDFDDLDAVTWAHETASMSGLGRDDLLLAVAVEAREYRVSAHDDLALTDAQLDEVEAERIEPQLRDDDWGGAAIAAADGYRAAATTSTSPWPFLLTVVVGPLVVGLLLWAAHRRRVARRAAAVGDIGPAGLTLEELEQRVGASLVAVDEAVRASEQELGFAQAQFGTEATMTFDDVIAKAKSTLTQAFALRRTVDDMDRDAARERREALVEVLRLCDEVDDALDAQKEAFDALRDLHARAPETLAELERRATELEQRLPAARATLATLAATYPPAALTSVQGNADAAQAVLSQARASVAQGQAALDTDRAKAVALARSAEDAVVRAGSLLAAVHGAGDE